MAGRLDELLEPYRNGMGLRNEDEDDLRIRRRDSYGSQQGRGRQRVRSAHGLTRFFNPDDTLLSRPFHGFPGGQAAWEHFVRTGNLPPGIELTPEQKTYYAKRKPTDIGFQDFYYRIDEPTPGQQPAFAGNTAPGSTYHSPGAPEPDFYYHVPFTPSASSAPPSPPPPEPTGDFYYRSKSAVPGVKTIKTLDDLL